LETPRGNQGSFDESSGWTPRFAEEYSVFNNTPGNLRGSSATFPEFALPTPSQRSAGHKRLLSAENVAAEIASQANHFSPDPRLPLPPVEPSHVLSSTQQSLPDSFSPKEPGTLVGSQGQSAKRVRRETVSEALVQTATPPPSSRKGERKLAPKLQLDRMQNEQSFGPEFVATTPQQQQGNMPVFVTTPTDMFGYPMSAPATAPVFTDSRVFWDADPNMGGMDMDFAATNANFFPTPSHRPMNSIDWSQSNEMFQQEAAGMQQKTEASGPARRERALAPKPVAPALDTSQQDTNMFNTSFTMSAEDPFTMLGQGDSVDPGLLFTQPPPSSMELATFDPLAQAPMLQSLSQPDPAMIGAVPAKRAELRRSASSKEVRTKKSDKISASSPTKPSDRPILSRSFSENKGRRLPGRSSSTLPTLAPARQMPQHKPSRPTSQMVRPNGRTSPLKNHHHRLSSLSSIPEAITPRPRTRTSVKFTIDARGRANAETTTEIIGEEGLSPSFRQPRTEPRGKRRSWGPPSDDDESSSSDDEPIIIPSRNASFALPDPKKPSSMHPFHASQRSISEQSAGSLGIFYNEPSGYAANDVESEAETVMQDSDATQGEGDAASELRKMVQDRQKREAQMSSQRFSSGMFGGVSSSTISPTTITEASLPTPPSSKGNAVRCICKKSEMPHGSDGFMVQW
jgi:hypothetical protein